VTLELVPFEPAHGRTVLGWVRSRAEAARWANAGDRDLTPAVFGEWHADPDVHPYLCLEEGRPVGYGEVWEDAAEGEAELARILVDPAERGRGVGRALTLLLAERARAAGFDAVWLRVVPDNEAALRAYAAAGFVRAGADEERAFNRGQPRRYAWLRDARAGRAS
jgi:ribosomal protein S18 acetylase RimI-like enzyme